MRRSIVLTLAAVFGTDVTVKVKVVFGVISVLTADSFAKPRSIPPPGLNPKRGSLRASHPFNLLKRGLSFGHHVESKLL